MNSSSTSSLRAQGPDDAAEADMAGRRVNRLGEARGRPVAPAVVRRAQMRSAFQHLARNPDRRLAGVVAVLGARAPWIARDAAGLRGIRRMLRLIPVSRPFPDVADRVVEA